MQVVAALGDAPTAAIAIVAILLGVLLAARGPREKRAAGRDSGGGEQSGPTLLKAPVAAAPEAEPGFVGPQGEVVGHGRIRLGAVGPLGGGEPAAAHPAAVTSVAPVEPEPEPESAPEPPPPAPPAPEPARFETPPAGSEQALFTSPPSLPDPPAVPPHDAATQPVTSPEPPPPAEEAPPPPAEEPAWRVAARAATSAVHFRQGTIKVGGKPAKKDQ